jgi:hypothetical protein
LFGRTPTFQGRYRLFISLEHNGADALLKTEPHVFV